MDRSQARDHHVTVHDPAVLRELRALATRAIATGVGTELRAFLERHQRANDERIESERAAPDRRALDTALARLRIFEASELADSPEGERVLAAIAYAHATPPLVAAVWLGRFHKSAARALRLRELGAPPEILRISLELVAGALEGMRGQTTHADDEEDAIEDEELVEACIRACQIPGARDLGIYDHGNRYSAGDPFLPMPREGDVPGPADWMRFCKSLALGPPRLEEGEHILGVADAVDLFRMVHGQHVTEHPPERFDELQAATKALRDGLIAAAKAKLHVLEWSSTGFVDTEPPDVP